MPQVITTNTGTVSGQDVIYDLSDKGANRGEGVVAYVDIELGVGGSNTFSIKMMDSQIDPVNYYYYSLESGGTLDIQEYIIPADGQYRIPLPLTSNEEKVALEFGDNTTATISVEFNIDHQYR